MATNRSAPNAEPRTEATETFNFKRVTLTKKVAGGARRRAPAIVLAPSGLADSNVNTGEQWDTCVAGWGMDVHTTGCYYEVDAEKAAVAVYPAGPNEPGLTPVRRNNNRTVSFHLGNVFEDYPMLRPVGNREVRVKQAQTADGKPYLLFLLMLAQVKPTSHRNSSSNSGTQSAEAAKQPAPAKAEAQPTPAEPAK